MRIPAAALTIILLLLPLLPGVAGQDTAREEGYAVEVQAGRWYAVPLPQNWAGAVAFSPRFGSVQVYTWSANTSWIIFYATFADVVYITRSTVQNPVLNTSSWFPPRRVAVSYNATVEVVRPDGTIMLQYRFSGTSSYALSQSTTVSFNPRTGVISVNASLIRGRVLAPSIFIEASNVWAATGATYTLRAMFTVNASPSHVQLISINVTGATPYRCTTALCSTRVNNRWYVTSTTDTSCTVQGLSSAVASNTNTIVNDNARIVTGTSTSSAESGNVNGVLVSYVAEVRAWLSSTRVYPIVNGIITAANNNVIHVVSNPQRIEVSVARMPHIVLYAVRLFISKPASTNFIVVNVTAQRVENPFVYVPEAGRIIPMHYFVNGSRLFGVAVSDALIGLTSVTAYVIPSFPRSIAESFRFSPEVMGIGSAFIMMTGTVYGSDPATFIRSEIVSIRDCQLVHMRLGNISARRLNMPMVRLNSESYYILKPNSTIVGNFTLPSRIAVLTPPIPQLCTIVSDVQFTAGLAGEGHVAMPITYYIRMAVLSSSITWGYRVPIYISLSSSTVAQGVVRLELPLGVYVRHGILSPALEDLLFTDSDGNVLHFYVAYWKSPDTAVVYVRLSKPLQAGTHTIFMYMYNRELWGTGNTFTSIQTFDFVNPPMPHAVGRIWNGFTAYHCMRIRLYATPWDYVEIDVRNGTVYEWHGSLMTRTARVPPIVGAKEVQVIVKGSEAWVFADGEPQYSINLEHVGDFQRIGYTEILYVGIEAYEVHVYHTTDYVYSVGGIQGAVARPPPAVAKDAKDGGAGGAQAITIDWVTMFMLIMVLIALAIVARIAQGGVGGRGGGVLSRF